jgi:hypothetical protein
MSMPLAGTHRPQHGSHDPDNSGGGEKSLDGEGRTRNLLTNNSSIPLSSSGREIVHAVGVMAHLSTNIWADQRKTVAAGTAESHGVDRIAQWRDSSVTWALVTGHSPTPSIRSVERPES